MPVLFSSPVSSPCKSLVVPSPAEQPTEASRAFTAAVRSELAEHEQDRAAFHRSLPGPTADESVTLPAGWTLHAEASVPLRFSADQSVVVIVEGQAVTHETYLLRLAQPDGGGWVITVGVRPHLRDGVMEAFERFEDLYLAMQHQVTYARRFPTSDPSGYVPVAMEMVRSFLLDRYDLTDPAQSAERMLVALGGTPRFVPPTLGR